MTTAVSSGSRRPRVLIFVENLPVPLDRRTWQEARTLAEDGWDVTVIGPKGPRDMRATRDRIDGIEVLRYPQRPASGLAGYLAEYLPSMMFSLIWYLRTSRRGRIDVVHGCNPPDLFWLFGRLARRRGGSYVFDQHDANPELSLTKFGNRGLKGRLLYQLTMKLERASYRTASLVLAPNDSYAELARQRGSVPAGQVRVVRNAPDAPHHRRLAEGINPEGLRVGYVGVFGSQDGLHILLDAWRRVIHVPDMADAVLELVGDGEARPALERQVRTEGMAHAVRFHGYLSSEEFVPILARCRLTVSPDPPTPFNNVSTMVKVLDSLAIGRPVVAFDLKETRRLIGDAGRIVADPDPHALADALTDLLRNPEETGRLGRLATQRVEELNLGWAASATVLREAYRELLPAPGAGQSPTGPAPSV